MRSSRYGQIRWVTEERPAAINLSGIAAAPVAAEAAEAKPVPNMPLTDRDAAVFLLHTAAEVEHALLVQYLYAAFSLETEQANFRGSAVPANAAMLTSRNDPESWNGKIMQTAREEMGHLLTLQNILLLLGGPVNLEREDFPFRSEFYPFPFLLEPFTKTALAKYIAAEMPAEVPLEVLSATDKDEILARARAAAGLPVNRVGALYGQMIALLESLDESAFRSDAGDWQGMKSEWHGAMVAFERDAAGTIVQVGPGVLVETPKTKQEAIDALRKISLQGEAATAEMTAMPTSHFARFLSIWKAPEFPDDQVTPRPWYPERPVPTHPNTTPAPAPGQVLSEEEIRLEKERGPGRITHPVAWLAAQLFNLRYRWLLTDIQHALSLHSGDDGRADTAVTRNLPQWAFREMRILTQTAAFLNSQPQGDAPQTVAAPPFELPYTLALPILERDRWRVHRDLLDTSADLIRQIREMSSDTTAFANVLQFDANRRAFIDEQGSKPAVRSAASPPVTPGSDPAAPAPAATITFARVKEILDASIVAWTTENGVAPDLTIHGPDFGWDTREQLLNAVARGNRLIAPELIGNGQGNQANLVIALQTGVAPFRRMPAGGPFVPADQVAEIVAWIDAGVPA